MFLEPGTGPYPSGGDFGDGGMRLGVDSPRWSRGDDKEPAFLSRQRGDFGDGGKRLGLDSPRWSGGHDRKPAFQQAIYYYGCPDVPDFESPRHQRVWVPPVNPARGNDLSPGPGAGMYPRRGDSRDGSMLLGPNDPCWSEGVDREPSFLSGQLGVPPGARFDPYGPPDVPGFEPSRFTRNPPRRRIWTHPDVEHFFF